ncbi:hypothetical protein MMC25_005424 [Agyrium rufum]|nr:hypothetical protein [Agyrium rufum]
MASNDATPTAEAHPAQTTGQNVESRQALSTWWNGFKKRTKKESAQAPQMEEPVGIFGVPLAESIKYANVAISLTDENGESFIYGYVPIIVAKCGVFLKEKATDVEGIFRLNGSSKRIKELQIAFDSPDRYGKGLDWTGYTVHDAANILRRYLTHLPQPIIPLDFYEPFREPLRRHQAQAVGDVEAPIQDQGDFDHDGAITTYQRLITELPPLNRQLLLYILDLLAVFASKSDVNLMTSANLSAIFQPGLLSHPTHDMAPAQYRLSQDVLIFLIDNQDSFLIGMSGTAADEKTMKEVQDGASSRQHSTANSLRNNQTGIRRSTSTASAGADSLRKFGGVRRNMSVSSRNSKNSNSPVTPSSGTPFASNNTGSGVHRSNTVPSKKSPGLSSSRFNRGMDSPGTPSPAPVPGGLLSPAGHALASNSPRSSSPSAAVSRNFSEASTPTPTPAAHPGLGIPISNPFNGSDQGNERLLSNDNTNVPLSSPSLEDSQTITTPIRERKLANLFGKSPTSDNERLDARQPNKLKKKRIPSSANPSAHSSTHSLSMQNPDSPGNQTFYTPAPTPSLHQLMQGDPLNNVSPIISNTAATPKAEKPHPFGDGANDPSTPQQYPTSSPPVANNKTSNLKPRTSPAPSTHSRSSVTDYSDMDRTDEAGSSTRSEKPQRRHRWRFSATTKKQGSVSAAAPGANTSSQNLGSNAVAGRSQQSVGSPPRPRRSMAVERSVQQQQPPVSSSGVLGAAAAAGGAQIPPPPPLTNDDIPSTLAPSNHDTTTTAADATDRSVSSEKDRSPQQQRSESSGGGGSGGGSGSAGGPENKKGPISWLKNKVAQAKEERKEREAEKEKERVKSPPPLTSSTMMRSDGGGGGEYGGSKQSLAAVVGQDSGGGAAAGSVPMAATTRGKSVDLRREERDQVEGGGEIRDLDLKNFDPRP